MRGSCTSDSFQCSNGQCIPISFYCDFIDQCGDNSDEEKCVYLNCTEDQYMCDNGQCVHISKKCDLIVDCIDGSDEVLCDVCTGFLCYYLDCIPNQAKCDGQKDCAGSENEDEVNCFNHNSTNDVESLPYGPCGPNGFKCNNGHCINRRWICVYDFDKFGYQRGCRDVTHLRHCELFSCPPTMFKCPDGYCIPLHRRCDGILDCPYGMDELNCDTYNCSGSYRCHQMKNCILLSERCDGIEHCWYGDDELLCGDTCPDNCVCHGSAIDCTNQNMSVLPYSASNKAKKLILSGNTLQLDNEDFEEFQLLAELVLSRNSITRIRPRQFLFLANLYLLNLEENDIQVLSENTFYGLHNLLELLLSGNGIVFVEIGAFQDLRNVKFLNLTSNDFNVESSSVFEPLEGLHEIHTDAYRYCCMVRKHQDVDVCTPLADPFSSCEDLMANQVLRWSIWVLGISAFLGNIFVIVWRIKENDLNKVPSFLIWNLALADFLMGIYMLIIASVDMYYRGVYVTYDTSWKNSLLCKFAGFLAALSSEVSVYTLTIITLDRFLIIAFPLKFIRIKLKTAVSMSGGLL
ncbi:G-protein coupled receptor GRL101-like [Ptychodera flava]|uniref:G-protein coupled receptor GRL101-like n=1 Tax=Ptychodera flava TaxID=63121 RepID=UPI003969EC1E